VPQITPKNFGGGSNKNLLRSLKPLRERGFP
jgi:hypothetical protein